MTHYFRIVIITMLSTQALNLSGMADVFKCFYIVRQAESRVIERFGKFSRVLSPGIRFKLPFVEQSRAVTWTGTIEKKTGFEHYRFTTDRIDIRERVNVLPSQSVITKDNVPMGINALVYYEINNPKNATYGIEDLPYGIEKLSQTTLRNVIGSMHLDETLVSRDSINIKLKEILNDAAGRWGVTVSRVELQEVNPPHEIVQAMERQMRAERDRRAEILDAEGKKRAAILRAEGEKSSAILIAEGEKAVAILKAEGQAEAQVKIAEAQAKALEMIGNTAKNKDPMPFVLGTKYIEAFAQMTSASKDKLVVVPYEASAMAGLLAGLKKVVEETK